MSCTLASLATCLSFANLYVDAGLSYHDSGPWLIREDVEITYLPEPNVPFQTRIVTTTEDFIRNPYGELALGYELRFHSIEWRMEVRHTSSVATSRDRGINSLAIKARWFPFRR